MTRIYHIFSLTLTLKLCNFVTATVEKNLLETIFVENFTSNIFVLMIFFEKMCCFRGKSEIYFGTSLPSDLMTYKGYE